MSASPQRCVVTRTLPGTAVARLARVHDVRVWPGALPPARKDLLGLVAEADGLLCLLTERIDEDVLAHAPRLRAISNYAVGFDNIDVAAARDRGIAVGNTPDALTDATADFTIALLTARARNLVEADAYARSGQWRSWEPALLLGKQVAGTTIGIVGPGRIGRAVADRARGLGMSVLLHRRTDDRDNLRHVLASSDYVSLHCPLTPETENIIDAETLGWMKRDAVLINTSRGRLIDLHALADALVADRLGGAALDTTEPEPIPLDHPLLAAPRLTLAPHLGSATAAARAAMADAAVDNLLLALDGLPMRYPVTPSPASTPQSAPEEAR